MQASGQGAYFSHGPGCELGPERQQYVSICLRDTGLVVGSTGLCSYSLQQQPAKSFCCSIDRAFVPQEVRDLYIKAQKRRPVKLGTRQEALQTNGCCTLRRFRGPCTLDAPGLHCTTRWANSAGSPG